MLFDETNWLAYRETNLLFAEAVRQEVKSGDMVWVQDYHLMLLPMMLRSLIEAPSERGSRMVQEMKDIRSGLQMTESRQRDLASGGGTTDGNSTRGNIKIGFFLHTPFPSSEIYRILPVRKEILLGVLHCDLIGFHTYDYARHFLSSCSRILGLSTMPNGVEFDGKYVNVGTFPIGIDPQQFLDVSHSPFQQSLKRNETDTNLVFHSYTDSRPTTSSRTYQRIRRALQRHAHRGRDR